jgi:hypothetical protein
MAYREGRKEKNRMANEATPADATQTDAPKKKAPKIPLTPEQRSKLRSTRHKLRAAARKKRALRLRTEKEFAEAYFAARSKRSTEKKQVFRKKKMRKK